MAFVVLDSEDREIAEVSTRQEAEKIADTLNDALESHKRAMQYFYGNIAPLGIASLAYLGGGIIRPARYSVAEVVEG